MPGSIHISATQPPVVTPLFLQVTVGNREYSGNIEQDGLSFPVTSLRESMVLMLYSADRELISKSELETKAIVESGTVDAVFALDSGGEIVLQVQFLLNDDDRKRVQEMRNSAMKMKQQELLGDGNELINFPDSPLSKRLIEKISNIQRKGAEERCELQKSLSLDDLQERAVFPGIGADPRMKASRDLLLQGGVRDTTLRLEDPGGSKQQAKIEPPVEGEGRRLGLDVASGGGRGVVGEAEQEAPEVSDGAVDAVAVLVCGAAEERREGRLAEQPGARGEATYGAASLALGHQSPSTCPPDRPGPGGSKKGDSIPESSKSSSSVKMMISTTFEGTTPKGIVSETDSGSTQAGETAIPSDDDHKASNHRPGKTVSSQHIEPIAPAQLQTSRTPKATESTRSRRSGSRDGASKQNLRENELTRTKRRSQAKRQLSIGPSSSSSCSPEQMQSRDYVERPLNYLVATSSTWIHPHICVTGASKQLRDLLELEHQNFQRAAKRQHVQKGRTQENKSDESVAAAARARSSGGFLMINGWLIIQGVRAAIVVTVCCGAMFFSSNR